jgi:hypothetical protein
MGLLGADHIEKSLPHIVGTLLEGVFTGNHIEMAVHLLLPVFIAMRMFTHISLLLHNLAADCLPRICLHGNIFTKPLPTNGRKCHNM